MNLLPWVSRRAFEEVRSERDRLREQNDELTEQLVRLTRVRNGRPEKVPEPKGNSNEPVPKKLREAIREFGSKGTQVRLLQQARREHARGRSWEDIYDDFQSQIERNTVR